MRERRNGRGVVVAIVVAVLAAAGLALAVIHTQAPPQGPQPVVWDKDACSHCHMHLSDPRFAAQLHTQDGRVLLFDDPGCLLRYLVEQKAQVRALWFHHGHDDRWLDGEHVAFAPAEATPMGYGLQAADPGTPGTVDLAGAEALVAQPQRGQP